MSSTTLTLYTFSKLCPFFKTLFMGMWLRAWCDMLEADEISKRKPNMGRQLLPLRFWGGDWQIGYIACIIASSLYSSSVTMGSKILWSCIETFITRGYKTDQSVFSFIPNFTIDSLLMVFDLIENFRFATGTNTFKNYQIVSHQIWN